MRNNQKSKNLSVLLITFITILIIINVGFLDSFSYGEYIDSIDPTDINPEDITGYIDLGQEIYTGEFMPAKKHFKGLGLSLTNITEESTGLIVISVANFNGKILDSTEIDLSNIIDKSWYEVYLNADLKVGKKYLYMIEARNCSVYPSLQTVNNNYLGKESINDNVLIGYIYSKSTFSLSERLLICILIFAIWLFGISEILLNQKQQKFVNLITAILLMVFGLTWNFMYNSFNDVNEDFNSFQISSETLVTGAIHADAANTVHSFYGLGRYHDLSGEYKWANNNSFLTDDNWYKGYSRLHPQILLTNTNIIKEASKAGNYIRFSNSEIFQILAQEESNEYLIITLNTEKALKYYKYGNILDAKLLDSDMKPITIQILNDYTSQYGLQGKIFRYIARCFSFEDILQILHFSCCLILAIILSILVLLISKKYNFLLAGCFFVVFLLSPWVVNFAKNLYWVEFTWFLPMAIGLFCSLYIKNKKCRLLSYFLIFCSILIKCLCGYEYVTTIMLSSVIFLTSDMIIFILSNNRKQALLAFKTVFIIGVISIFAFLTAICMHSYIYGNGNIAEGINYIIIDKALSRTFGGVLNIPDYSIWQVLKLYFHFNTEIITGISGDLFPLICIIPIIILVYNCKKGKNNWTDIILYIGFFITSISWFVLGKIHSYNHPHMNFVLWYFGYIQICFYIICRQIVYYIFYSKKIST